MKRPSLTLNKPEGGLTYFSYRLLSRYLSRIYPVLTRLKPVLAKANIRIGFKAYVSRMVFVTMVTSAATLASILVASAAVPTLIPRLIHPTALLVLGPLASGSITFMLYWLMPFNRIKARRSRTDQLLPITSSYLTVLAASGAPPEKVLRTAANANPKAVLSDEIQSIVIKMDVLGYDILSAIDEEVERTPSNLYSNLLRGLASSIRTGGDLRKFFSIVTKQLLNRRSSMIQQFLDTLTMLSETQVLMFTVFPLLLIIMLSIMASIGSSLGGFNVLQLMYLVSLVLIPLLSIVFLIILEVIQPKS